MKIFLKSSYWVVQNGLWKGDLLEEMGIPPFPLPPYPRMYPPSLGHTAWEGHFQVAWYQHYWQCSPGANSIPEERKKE